MNRVCIRDNERLRFADLRLFRDRERGIERCAAAVTTGTSPTGLGGTRQACWASDSNMLEDLLRLAEGMRLKSAFHELPFTGAKVCVELTPGADVELAFQAVGEFVKEFGGQLLTTEDSGTDPAKMEIMHRVAAPYVLGRPTSSGGTGDPSPYTALGVLHGLKAVSGQVLGRSGELDGVRFLVKGVGHVGSELVSLLLNEGAHVFLADREWLRLEPFLDSPQVTAVDNLETIPAVDVYCPCAGGGDIDHSFALPSLRAIAGAANNQLVCDEVAVTLAQKGVTYVPDWVINGGGLISVAAEHLGENREWVTGKVRSIGARISSLLAEARERRMTPLAVANEVCEVPRQIETA